MALPTAYLTSAKNLEAILTAVQNAQAPDQFSYSFLENLGFKSSSDRNVVSVLKSIGFLDAVGKPTDRYFRYLDQTQSARVLAEGIREAYADLYQLNRKAETMPRSAVKNKFKTLSQGQLTDTVLDNMALTFATLSKLADFDSLEESSPDGAGSARVFEEQAPEERTTAQPPPTLQPKSAPLQYGGLVYNIQIVLPESRDSAVYDALFRSLRTHLL
jgi:hypothetical protein